MAAHNEPAAGSLPAAGQTSHIWTQSDPTTATDRASETYRAARADARHYSTDALLGTADALDLALVDARLDFDAHTAAVAACLIGDRLAAIRDELDHRERLHRLGTGVASPADRRYQDWRELARTVRERADLVAVFRAAGWSLTRTGRDPRRGGWEWAGACPVCGGTDRLRVWDGPNGRAWCRQCGWSADVITAAQSLLPGCAHFRDAVRALAGGIVAGMDGAA